MMTLNNEWATYLKKQMWTHIATVRMHYKINEYGADKMTTALVKSKPINHLFYAVEKDRYDINHIHLLINANTSLSMEKVARGLGKYTKAVSFLEKVNDQDAVSWYCSKQLSMGVPHDLKFKNQYT